MILKRLLAGGIVAVAVLAGLLLPVNAYASSLARLVFGGTYILESGEILSEDLTIFGGNAVLEQDSVVKGNVQLLGGRLEVNGTVDGSIVAAGGVLKFGRSAVVEGDVTMAGAVMDRDSGAVIEGEVITQTDIPIHLTRFDGLWTPFRWMYNSFWDVVWSIGLAFALAALAVLVVMFFETFTERTTRAVMVDPISATGLGCLTLFVAPFAFILLVLTLCLIPFALVALLVIGVAITFGWIALGLEVGKRLALLVQRQWAAPFAAGIGTFLLVLVGGLLNIIPFIGWVYTVMVSAAGIGAVLLTRFGTQEFSPGPKLRYLPPAEEPVTQADDSEDEMSENGSNI